MSELDEALKRLKIALLDPDFIKTIILVWATMLGTILILWLAGDLS